MSEVPDLAESTFRDYVIPDVPSSGDYEPQKAEVRATFQKVGEEIDAIAPAAAEAAATATAAAEAAEAAAANAATGYLSFTTTSAMTAFTTADDNQTAYNAETDSYYRWNDGGSAWVFVREAENARIETIEDDIYTTTSDEDDFFLINPTADEDGKVLSAYDVFGNLNVNGLTLGMDFDRGDDDSPLMGSISDLAGKMWLGLLEDGRVALVRDTESTSDGDYVGKPIFMETDSFGRIIRSVNGDGRSYIPLSDEAIAYVADRIGETGGGTLPIPADLFEDEDRVRLQYVFSSVEEGWATQYAYRDVEDPIVAVAVTAEVELDPIEGQSNGIALSTVTGNVLTTPLHPHRNLTMTGGTWGPVFASSASGSAPSAAYDGTQITDLKQCAEGGSHESVVTSMLNMMQALDVANGIIPDTRVGWAGGLGATAIASFLKGQPNLYANSILLVDKAIEQLRSYGVSKIVCYTYGWDQGEADWPATPRATYVSRFNTLRTAKEADIIARTKQTVPVWFVVRAVNDQVGDHDFGGTPGVSNYLTMMQSLRTAVAVSEYFLSGTTYGMDGGQHFRPAANDLRAEYYAKARWHIASQIKRAVAARIDPWTLTIASTYLDAGVRDVRPCLYVYGATRSGSTITLDLALPFDSTTVVEDLVTLGDGNNAGASGGPIVKGIQQTAGGGNVTGVTLTNPSPGVYKLAVTSSVAGAGTLAFDATVSDVLGGTRSSSYSVFKAPSSIASIANPDVNLDNWIVPFTIDYT